MTKEGHLVVLRLLEEIIPWNYMRDKILEIEAWEAAEEYSHCLLMGTDFLDLICSNFPDSFYIQIQEIYSNKKSDEEISKERLDLIKNYINDKVNKV